jgi:UDP-2-acetamido-2,6-beta-L-arabino-hexul-4-ose reductase
MEQPVRRILVTGAHGFIGKNLIVRLRELQNSFVIEFARGDSLEKLSSCLAQADAVVHLAGENRPTDESAFTDVNTGLTLAICDAIRQTGRTIPLILASSVQAEYDNLYGKSKLAAEQAVKALHNTSGNPAVIFRFPGVFGKWCKPFYNSVVATFCHSIANGFPIQINDPATSLRLVYIDDVVSALIAALDTQVTHLEYGTVMPEYTIKLGELATQIQSFDTCRNSLLTERVGTGLVRALYATYISYLPNDRFAYKLPQHADERGVFVEMLKTPDCGQFSYFTAQPGVTRGGHYHHTKTEKFLVLKSQALFRFRHLLTNELIELTTSGDNPQVVDTIPGWAHDITNIGNEELIVMLWANENFDRERPDTISQKV